MRCRIHRIRSLIERRGTRGTLVSKAFIVREFRFYSDSILANVRGDGKIPYNVREAQTITEDMFIRKFITGTFHGNQKHESRLSLTPILNSPQAWYARKSSSSDSLTQFASARLCRAVSPRESFTFSSAMQRRCSRTGCSARRPWRYKRSRTRRKSSSNTFRLSA